MKKIEIMDKIRQNVLEITREVSVRSTSGNTTQYIYEVLITVDNGAQINNQEIFVVNEGTENEIAYFVNGREVKNTELLEPSREKKLKQTLNQLKLQGTVKGVDLSHLEVAYAVLQINDTRTFVAILDGELILLDAA